MVRGFLIKHVEMS